MLKRDRIRLAAKMRELIASFAKEIIPKDLTPETDFSWVAISPQYGEVRGSYVNPTDFNDVPALYCRLEGWPRDRTVRVWNGFRHWKQNLRLTGMVTPDIFVQHATWHLQQLGLSPATKAS